MTTAIFKTMRRLITILAFLAATSAAHAANPLDHWQWRTPLPQGYSLHGAALSASHFVAVGELGTIIVSTDGQDWVVTNAPVLTNLNAVVFAYDRFVAVGDGGTIVTSSDGLSWTLQASPVVDPLNAVVGANGLFVAVGNRGRIITSSNGSLWEPRESSAGLQTLLRDVTYGDGRFVAVGTTLRFDFYSGTSVVSTDGVYWEPIQAEAPFDRVTFGNGIFLAAASGHFASSPDGAHWIHHYLGNQTNASDVTFDNGQFIAASHLGVMTSADGISWTVVANNITDTTSIAVSGNRALAVGPSGRLGTSTTLTEWSLISSGPAVALTAITFGQGRFVGVNGRSIVTSVDGHQWDHRVAGPTASLRDVAGSRGLFIAVGHPLVATTNVISSDGLSWSPLSIPTTNGLNGIAFLQDRFVTVGELGTVCDSPDGQQWTTRFVPGGPILLSIAKINGRYVALGAGSIFVSDDLATWTPAGGEDVNWWGAAHGNGVLVAVGSTQFGKSAVPVMRSFNGLNWEAGSSAPNMRRVAYGRGVFVGAAQEGIYYSTNGLNWVLVKGLAFTIAQSVGFGGDTFVASRYPGGIVQSDKFPPLPQLSAPAFTQDQFAFTLTGGEPGRIVELQSSTDFSQWFTETNFALGSSPITWTNRTSAPARFYRAIQQ